MKNLKLFFLAVIFSACNMQVINKVSVSVSNPIDAARTDALIEVPLSEISIRLGSEDYSQLCLFLNEEHIPFQMIDNNSDGKPDVLIFTDNFAGLKTKEYTVSILSFGESKPEFKSRVYAEVARKEDYTYTKGKFSGGYYKNVDSITVPAIHKDHDSLFKYEGPGWESEKVGYRFYLDWRNSNDIFGKKTTDLVLKQVGSKSLEAQNDSYHEMADWGMDIFKVGTSLGIGTLASYENGEVVKISKTDSVVCVIKENGPVTATIKTKYYRWDSGVSKYNVESNYSINAGSRLTKHRAVFNNSPAKLATGLAKYENTVYTNSESSGAWNYIALYGKQSLADDMLGIVLFYKNENLVELTEDDVNHLVVLRANNNELTYYFGAAWEQEKNGIKTEKDFYEYLNQQLDELNNPLKIRID